MILRRKNERSLKNVSNETSNEQIIDETKFPGRNLTQSSCRKISPARTAQFGSFARLKNGARLTSFGPARTLT